jgi:hypothetical protein
VCASGGGGGDGVAETAVSEVPTYSLPSLWLPAVVAGMLFVSVRVFLWFRQRRVAAVPAGCCDWWPAALSAQSNQSESYAYGSVNMADVDQLDRDIDVDVDVDNLRMRHEAPNHVDDDPQDRGNAAAAAATAAAAAALTEVRSASAWESIGRVSIDRSSRNVIGGDTFVRSLPRVPLATLTAPLPLTTTHPMISYEDLWDHDETDEQGTYVTVYSELDGDLESGGASAAAHDIVGSDSDGKELEFDIDQLIAAHPTTLSSAPAGRVTFATSAAKYTYNLDLPELDHDLER